MTPVVPFRNWLDCPAVWYVVTHSLQSKMGGHSDEPFSPAPADSATAKSARIPLGSVWDWPRVDQCRTGHDNLTDCRSSHVYIGGGTLVDREPYQRAALHTLGH